MRLLCQVAYKGTNYQGWQKQKDAPTIQETIEKVISKVLNSEINIYASGRTDAGVHAQRQYFHFDIDKMSISISLDTHSIVYSQKTSILTKLSKSQMISMRDFLLNQKHTLMSLD